MKVNYKTLTSLLIIFIYSEAIAENTLKIKDGIVTGYGGVLAEDFKLPKHVTSIGRQAFEENPYLKKINLSECERLFLIDYAAFQRCEFLEQIEFPKNLQMIKGFAFNYCKKLLNVDLSNCEDLSLIDEYSFNKCENLKVLKLPKSLKKIGNRAFYRCNRLKEIDLSHCKNLEYIGEKAFDFSRSSPYEKPNNVSIKLPFNVAFIYKNSFGSKNYYQLLLIPQGAKELRQKIIKSGFPKERIKEY